MHDQELCFFPTEARLDHSKDAFYLTSLAGPIYQFQTEYDNYWFLSDWLCLFGLKPQISR